MGISTSKRWRYLISQNEEIKINGDVTNQIADLTVKSQCIVSLVARFADILQGLVTVPFWEYWTLPYRTYSSHYIDHIPNGWVMFNGDI